MLGDTGQGPISDGSGPGRIIALAAAVLLLLGGGYYAVSGSDGLTFAMLRPAPAPAPASAAPTAAIVPAKPLGSRPRLRPTYVYDQADVLSDDAAANLDTLLGGLHTGSGPEVVVMTVPTLSGSAIDVFARKVASQWGFGDPVRNDGVLLLVAPNERQVRIEVGTGLEGTLTNRVCQDIIDEDMLPLFRQGQIERATAAGALALSRQLAAHPTLSPQVR